MSTGLRFTLEVDGLPPDAFAVVSFHLNQSLSSLHFHIVDNVGFVHAGCGVNALSGMKTLQIQ